MAEFVKQFCCEEHAEYELEIPCAEEEGVERSSGTIA